MPSSDPKVAGYKIYEGTASRVYTKVHSYGIAATNTTFSSLVAGQVYYFAATTYDKAGNQSAYSDEIVYVDGAATFSSVNRTGDQFSFVIQGLAGKKYVVQSSTDLVKWTSCSTNAAPFGYIASNCSVYPRRFFRATLLQ